MTIYFVDEDYPKLYSWLVELEFRGYTVKPLADADRALETLQHSMSIDWVIIDVMLAASEQPDSRYREERTDQGLITGLRLLGDLAELRPDVFPRKAQLLTAATNKHPYVEAHRFATEFGVELTLKTDIDSPRDFGDAVEAAMQAANARDYSGDARESK